MFNGVSCGVSKKMAELSILNRTARLKPERAAEVDGSPLGVCINDCEIDYGQPWGDLVHVCFSLGCAFAEMRWGKLAEADANATGPKFTYSVAS